jgi:acyl carrier protein
MASPADDRARAWQLLVKGLPAAAAGQELQDSTLLRDLGMDSLATLLVITSFCESFGVELEALPGEIGRLDTVADLVNLGTALARCGKPAQAANEAEHV